MFPVKGIFKEGCISFRVFVFLRNDTQKYVTLSKEEQKILGNLVRTSSSHQLRQRSEALLWSHQGKDRAAIAELYDVQKNTVSARFSNQTPNRNSI